MEKVNKMTKVQRKLKSFGVPFTVTVDDNELMTINFVGDDGKNYEIKERQYRSKLFYEINEINESLWQLNSQAEICVWLEKSKDLLTDYEAHQKKQEEIKRINDERKREIEVIDTKTYCFGNYQLEILKQRNGAFRYVLKNLSENYRKPEIVIDNYFSNTDVKFKIYASTASAMNVQEAEERIKDLQMAVDAVKYFEEKIKENKGGE